MLTAAYAGFERCIGRRPPDDGDYSPLALIQAQQVASFFFAMRELIGDPSQEASAHFMRSWPPGFVWAQYMRGGLNNEFAMLSGSSKVSARRLCALGVCTFASASIKCEETQEAYMHRREISQFYIDIWAMESTDREVSRYSAEALNALLYVRHGEDLDAFLAALGARFPSLYSLALHGTGRMRATLDDLSDPRETYSHLPVLLLVADMKKTPQEDDKMRKEILASVLDVMHAYPAFTPQDHLPLATTCILAITRIMLCPVFVTRAFRMGLIGPLFKVGPLLGFLNDEDQEQVTHSLELAIFCAMQDPHCFKSAQRDLYNYTKDTGSLEISSNSDKYKSFLTKLEAVTLEHAVLRNLHNRGVCLVERYCSRVSSLSQQQKQMLTRF